VVVYATEYQIFTALVRAMRVGRDAGYGACRGVTVGRVFGRELAQRAPTGAKSGASKEGPNDRCHWGSLEDVAASTRPHNPRKASVKFVAGDDR
jgi:hypothetical protein